MNDFKWLPVDKASHLLADFDCGDDLFNSFLKEEAETWSINGQGVTYVAVIDEELGKDSVILAYATISATGLMRSDNSRIYDPCAEIRLFAVNKVLRGPEGTDSDGKRYSYKLFQSLMQEIYSISTQVIGFTIVILNANSKGIRLYKDFGFVESKDFIFAEDEEKISLEGCIPLLYKLNSSDAIYDIFS